MAIAVKTPTISTASGDYGRSMGGFAFSRSESKPRKWWTRKLRERGSRRRGHSGSRIHLDHRSAGRSVIQDHSSDHRFKRLHLTRASVRRASGFVLTGKWEFIGSSIGLVPTNGLGGDRCDFIEADFLGPIYLRSAKLS